MREVLTSGVTSGGAPPEDVSSSRLNKGNAPVDFELFEFLEDLGNLTPEKVAEARGEMKRPINRRCLLTEMGIVHAILTTRHIWST